MQPSLPLRSPLPKIIGITGRAGVGKDTLADFLELGEGYYRYSLAQPLKRGLEEMFSLSPKVWDRANKEVVIPWIGKSPRQLAQTLGTEWGRHLVADDIWLRCLGQVIDSLPPTAEGLVIPDVRFENEASYIQARGGVVIRVFRNVPGVSPHPSEAGVPDNLVNINVVNDTTVEKYIYDALLALSRCPRPHEENDR